MAKENAELKSRVAKLEQRQLQNDEKSNFIAKSDDNIREIKQSSVNISSTGMENSNDTHASNSDELNNAPNSDPTSQDQDPIQKNYTPQINQNVLEEPQTQSTISSKIKIPYNQKVEQGLLHELFEFIRGTDSMSLQNLKKTPLNSSFIKQISDIPIDIDLTPGSIIWQELDAKISSFKSQKLIGVKNSSCAHGQLKSDIETKVCEETLPKTEVCITTTPSILSSQISSHSVTAFSNSEDIVNENGEFSKIVNVFDGFLDSNSDS
ncbi:2093_t:CDS:2, partial [Diversispora eburnea]